jgi:hypothetical protein
MSSSLKEAVILKRELELAIRRGLPLASLDINLRKAAKSEGMQLLPGKI